MFIRVDRHDNKGLLSQLDEGTGECKMAFRQKQFYKIPNYKTGFGLQGGLIMWTT